MQLSLANHDSKFSISAYDPGKIVVGGQTYTESILLLPDQIDRWRPSSIDDLQPGDFTHLVNLAPDVILLGTGERQIFPSVELYEPLIQSGIGIEIMDSAAACRTYKILLAEGRRVAAALLLK